MAFTYNPIMLAPLASNFKSGEKCVACLLVLKAPHPSICSSSQKLAKMYPKMESPNPVKANHPLNFLYEYTCWVYNVLLDEQNPKRDSGKPKSRFRTIW